MKLVKGIHFLSFWGNKVFVALLASFALVACSNSVGDDVASANPNGNSAVATLEPAVGPQIEFTGNPVYDMGLLNDYWKGLGKSLDERNGILGGSNTSVLTKASASPQNMVGLQFEPDINLGKDIFKWLNDFGGSKIKNPALKALYQVGLGEVAKALGCADISNAKVLKAVNEVLDEVKAMRKQLDEMQDYLEKHISTVVMSAEELTLAKERILARNKAYDEHQTHLKLDFYDALQSLFFNALKASGVGEFKKIDEWNALSDAERAEYLTDEKYKAYMEEHNDSLSGEVERIILEWGDATVAGNPAANAAVNVVKMLMDEITISNRVAVKSLADLYELLAYETVVWEAEGYEWRQQMINADVAFLAELSLAASWYYVVKKNDQAVADLEKNAEKLQKYIESHKVIRHTTPIYVKSGSKSRDQVFTGKIKQIKYGEVLKTKWQTKATRSLTKKIAKKYPLKEESYKYNASRIYGGFAPANPGDNIMNVYSESAKLGMPEDFYKELYESYAVQTPNGVKRKPLLQIFKDAGFTMESGEDIPIKPYQKQKTEQFFVTNLRPYTRTSKIPSLCARCYHLGVSVAIANTDGDIYGISNHESYVVAYEARYAYTVSHYGKKAHENDFTDNYRIYMSMKNDYASYRDWFYPVKTDKAVAFEEK